MKLERDHDKWAVQTYDNEFAIKNNYMMKTEEDVLKFILGEYVVDYYNHIVQLDYAEVIEGIQHKINYYVEEDEDV